jgi:hypothetical protein
MMELIYSSAQCQPFSPRQLTELLSKSRQNNRALGVSGLLLYHRGSFLQVLEGEESVVSSLYDKIAKDTRHHQFTVVKRTTIAERTFPDWSMGFGEVSSTVAKKLDAFTSFLQPGVLDATGIADQVRKVLYGFRPVGWRHQVN